MELIQWHKGYSDGIIQSTRNGQNQGEVLGNQMSSEDSVSSYEKF